jgi:hypothetical protein
VSQGKETLVETAVNTATTCHYTCSLLGSPSARTRLNGWNEPILGQMVWTRDFYAAVNEAALGHVWARQMSGFLSCPRLHKNMHLARTWPKSGRCQSFQSLSANESSHDRDESLVPSGVPTTWKCTKERDLESSFTLRHKTLTSSRCDVMKRVLGNGLHV